MTKAAASNKKRVQVRYYKLRNRLKEKAGGGGGARGTIAAEALEAAEAEFEKMAEDYPDWVQTHINELYTFHRRCVDTPEDRTKLFKRVNEVAHDMRGQGGTFGYPLISHFGDSLYEASRIETVSDNHVEILKAHVDAMNAVIKGRVNGDGGEVGIELRKTLEAAIDKYSVTE
ncbi:MAG: hypothetical protein MI806_31170 [Minwuiales bacterium]|nr:hypothetical protein [Minwuiales bacterium]